LAEIAGLSRSRFAELFVEAVGETPLAYLRRWRLVLARKDLERGDRVQAVSRRYGYASGEAFNRAFQRFFGCAPTGLRTGAQGSA
ncbi:MAG: helix-turn-helix transcriptional regulator, partial [Pseudomonadota bacterium]